MSLINTYLIGYNVFQLALQWLTIIRVAQYKLADGSQATAWFELPDGSYQVAATFVRTIVVVQWVELVHSLLGWSKGSPKANVLQAGLKSIFFFALLEQEPAIELYASSKCVVSCRCPSLSFLHFSAHWT